MKFKNHNADERVKLLLIGDSGSGKTTLLASLANQDYNVRILDFDNGLDPLWDPNFGLTPDGVERTSHITLVDGAIGIDKKPTLGLMRATDILYKGWKDEDEDLGIPASWGSDDVLVIDSLTLLSDSAKKMALAAQGRKVDEALAQKDWYEAQRRVSNFITYITSSALKCNVVVTAHMYFIEEEGKAARAYPASAGRGLSTTIARYFNNVFRIDCSIVGSEVKRSVRTISDYRADLKNSAPSVIKPSEPMDLASIFNRIKENAKKQKVNNE